MKKTISESGIITGTGRKKIREFRFLTGSTFVIRFDRDNLHLLQDSILLLAQKVPEPERVLNL